MCSVRYKHSFGVSHLYVCSFEFYILFWHAHFECQFHTSTYSIPMEISHPFYVAKTQILFFFPARVCLHCQCRGSLPGWPSSRRLQFLVVVQVTLAAVSGTGSPHLLRHPAGQSASRHPVQSLDATIPILCASKGQ